jgi:hypothetical protein
MLSSAAIALVLGFNAPAHAAVATPKLVAPKFTAQDFVAEAAWKCGTHRCFWDPAYTGPVPDFATSWGPPNPPTCYYAQRRISKRWRMVCPEVPLQAH